MKVRPHVKKTLTVMTMVIALAMSNVAMAIGSSTLGNDAVSRAWVDSWSNFTVVDTNNSADVHGTISEVEFYAHRAGSVRFVIVDSAQVVTAVSEVFTAPGSGKFTAPFAAGVTPGDNLGVYSVGNGVVSFDYDTTAATAYWTDNNSGQPTIGTLLNNEGDGRIYSMNATITPRPDAKDACKNGGWEGFYRNQGQCVSAFARAK